jgi:hypothetical protein
MSGRIAQRLRRLEAQRQAERQRRRADTGENREWMLAKIAQLRARQSPEERAAIAARLAAETPEERQARFDKVFARVLAYQRERGLIAR